jgi:hypothetical protein
MSETESADRLLTRFMMAASLDAGTETTNAGPASPGYQAAGTTLPLIYRVMA